MFENSFDIREHFKNCNGISAPQLRGLSEKFADTANKTRIVY